MSAYCNIPYHQAWDKKWKKSHFKQSSKNMRTHKGIRPAYPQSLSEIEDAHSF